MAYFIGAILIVAAAIGAYVYASKRSEEKVRAELAAQLQAMTEAVEKHEKIAKQLRQENADLSYQLSNANKSVQALESSVLKLKEAAATATPSIAS